MTFNITPEKLEELRTRAAASGFKIEGNEGEASADGVTISYKYEPNTLTTTVLKKPFWMPLHVVTDHIVSWIHG